MDYIPAPVMTPSTPVYLDGQYGPPPSPRPAIPPFPPGLRLPPPQYTKHCPGLPAQMVEEHRRLLDSSHRQHEMVQSLHLELCSAHARMNEKEETLSRLELRLAELEGKQLGDQMMGEDLMTDFA